MAKKSAALFEQLNSHISSEEGDALKQKIKARLVLFVDATFTYFLLAQSVDTFSASAGACGLQYR